MVLSSEFRFKARQAVDELVDGISQELDRRSRLDQIEKSLFRGLMELGKSLLQDSVDEVADEEERGAPESLLDEAGIALQRVERTPQRLVTVFGQLRIRGPVYAVRRKQKIQRAPVDERLALPAGEFSYLFEDWAQRMVVKDAFAEAAESLHELLGIDVSVPSLEGMNCRMAADVEAFREQQPAPPPTTKASCWSCISDATGVPMHRRGGPLSDLGRRQMAYLGASYTVDRFPRTVDQVLDEVLRKECAKSRPRPKHRRLYGDMTRALPDDPDTEFDGRVGVIEGACRHVVGDRLDRTGTRWTIEGAVSMLATRTTYLSDDWNEYQKFRSKREQTRLHPTAKI